MSYPMRELHEELIRFSKSLHMLRQHSPSGPATTASIPLLALLVRQGPARSRDLAQAVCLDPSTVSRQVEQLVRAGHVVRTADPHDGRATLLQATPAGVEELAAHRGRMEQLLDYLVEGWSADDVTGLVEALRRLNDSTADRLPRYLDLPARERAG
jgi:DNA-binding MarR family transcriptional regulator